MDYRSPLENIFNVISSLPQGHDKPVKQAVYNAIALLLLCISCCAVWALYLILEPFVKPLIWALLVGSVLHPFKFSLTQMFRTWFDTMEESRTPIIFGLCFIPVNIVNNFSEIIGGRILKYKWIILCLLAIVFSIHLIYYRIPNVVLSLACILVQNFNNIVTIIINCTSLTNISILVFSYAMLMLYLWSPENNKKFHYTSILIWLFISCFIAKQFGSFQLPIFILLHLVLIGGFIFEVLDIRNELNGFTSDKEYSFFDAIRLALQGEDRGEVKILLSKNREGVINSSIEGETENKYSQLKDGNAEKSEDLIDESDKDFPKDISIRKPQTLIEKKLHPRVRRSLSQPYIGLNQSRMSILSWRRRSDQFSDKSDAIEESLSYFYIVSVLWACGAMILYKNPMLLPILFIPLLIYVVKHIGKYLGFWEWLYIYLSKGFQLTHDWCQKRYDCLVPVHVRGLYRILHISNMWIKQEIKDSIDTVASCVVICGLIVLVVVGSIFIFVQVYAEAIMLVQMTSSLINQTVVHNPELRQLLPPTFDNTVDSILDNAYQYGREGISKGVRSFMHNVDTNKSEKLERQVLELWDRLYQTWMTSDDQHGPKVTSDAVTVSWNNFIHDLWSSPEMFNFKGIISFVNQNIDTSLSLLDSIWSIVKGNISLLIGSLSAILSILLDGSTAVLNFIINMIIFFTTLFYLLNNSGALYKPVEYMTQFSTNGSRFGLALGDAVNGVFAASFKMSVFYGLWTWLIHNLFNVKIVYLPSVLAAILGAAPFLGTYWACIPAVLDLWLAQEKNIQAILFAIFQFIPTYIVDTTIYAEMKGGHPYLTGLAIAGGIFCFGLAGAIVGPLVLCGLYVVMDLSTTMFNESPSEESNIIQQISR